jgi:hypothetical protein
VVPVRDRRTLAALLVPTAISSVTILGCTSGPPATVMPGPATARPAAAAPAARAVPAAGAVPIAAVARAVPGWPAPKAAYLGRYTLTWASDPSFARGGLLTLFLRQVTKPKAMIVPSGIISVYGPGSTSVLYLSRFGHLGPRGVASVTAGLYTTAPAGTVALTAFSSASHTLTLVLSAPGSAPVAMRFTRYSASPHP